MRMELMCGVSSDSYQEKSNIMHQFEIRQMDANGSILAESHVALQPGMNAKDRDWRPMQIALKQTHNGVLAFSYVCSEKEFSNIGAFAQSILRPVD